MDRLDGKHVVREDPIALVDVFIQLGTVVDAERERCGFQGENLSKVLLEVIDRCHLDKEYLIAQCYDVAVAMASENVGVVTRRLQEVAPLAFYYHCAMYGLNLATSEINSGDRDRVRHGQRKTQRCPAAKRTGKAVWSNGAQQAMPDQVRGTPLIGPDSASSWRRS